MVAEEVAMVNFSPITSEQGGQVLDYQKHLAGHAAEGAGDLVLAQGCQYVSDAARGWTLVIHGPPACV